MKYLYSIHDFIFESVESYQWELVSDVGDNSKKTTYSFIDSIGNKYNVEFNGKLNLRQKRTESITEYELSYYVYDESNQSYTSTKIVNVNPYRILQTVFGGIINDFVKRNHLVKKITMFGLSKDREKHFISQRTRMYVRYLERNPIPGFTMTNYSNTINLIKN